jgi:hypothetical protein
MTERIDNVIVRVPHPLIHFPFFFVSNNPEEGFFYSKPNKYGDLVTVQAPKTPRVREAIVFLASLTFFQDEVSPFDCDPISRRVAVTISRKAWMKVAGFGRSGHDKEAFKDAVDILSKVVYEVEREGAKTKRKYKDEVFKPRRNRLPFRKAIFPGLFGDVIFHENDTITIHVLQDFVQGLDKHALRVSLAHMLQMRGHVARALTFIMYGRSSWSGTWEELAELVRIDHWKERWKQKQSLKKALDEMQGKGFTYESTKTTVVLKRTAGLTKTLPDYS